MDSWLFLNQNVLTCFTKSDFLFFHFWYECGIVKSISWSKICRNISTDTQSWIFLQRRWSWETTSVLLCCPNHIQTSSLPGYSVGFSGRNSRTHQKSCKHFKLCYEVTKTRSSRCTTMSICINFQSLFSLTFHKCYASEIVSIIFVVWEINE